MNVFDAVIAVLLAVALFFAVRHIRRRGLNCGCGCEECGKLCTKAKKPSK